MYSIWECLGSICAHMMWNAKCLFSETSIGSRNLMFIDVQYQITLILIGLLSMDLLTLETVIFT